MDSITTDGTANDDRREVRHVEAIDIIHNCRDLLEAIECVADGIEAMHRRCAIYAVINVLGEKLSEASAALGEPIVPYGNRPTSL